MYDINDIVNTIICGNALTELRKIPRDSIDLVLCSPPYHLKRKYFAGPQEIGQEKSFLDYIQNLVNIFFECKRVIKESGNIFIVVGDYYNKDHSLIGIPEFLHVELVKQLGLIRRHRIIWWKRNGKQRASRIYKYMHNNHEIILHYTKTSNISKMYFEVPMVKAAQSTIDQYKKYYTGKAQKDYEKHKAIDPSKTKANIIKRKFAPYGGNKYVNNPNVNDAVYSGKEYIPQEYSIDGNVWDILHPTKNEIKHYAMWPLELSDKIIKAACPPNGIVLDPMNGSGQTSISAITNGRRFIGIELNQEYVDISRQRVEKYLLGIL